MALTFHWEPLYIVAIWCGYPDNSVDNDVEVNKKYKEVATREKWWWAISSNDEADVQDISS